MLLVKVLILQLFFKVRALVQPEIWHSSLITESKIIDLVLKNLISICGGRFACNTWEIFIKNHLNNTHRAKPRQHHLGGLVLHFMLSFEVMLSFLVISLHAASSICHSHSKAAPAGLWSENTAAGNLLWRFDRMRWERRFLLCWPLAVNLPMLCLNYELDEVWKVSVDPWPGRVNVEESLVESLELEGMASWGIGFGSYSTLHLLIALNNFFQARD